MKRTFVALAVLGLGASAAQAQEVVKLGAAAPPSTQSHLGKDIGTACASPSPRNTTPKV